ncbi:MAG: 6-phosphofructokinase, partial [Gemmatimonadales bacterium]
MGKGNAVVGQSGGPTSVINSSLAGIVQGCSQVADIDRVFGMRWGIEGFMAGQLVDLSAQSAETIEGLRRTPSSV